MIFDDVNSEFSFEKKLSNIAYIVLRATQKNIARIIDFHISF